VIGTRLLSFQTRHSLNVAAQSRELELSSALEDDHSVQHDCTLLVIAFGSLSTCKASYIHAQIAMDEPR
jgi:hypothetical protein